MNQNQNTERKFTEVNAQSNNRRWEPHKNEADAKYPKEVGGYFKDMRQMPGSNGEFAVAVIVSVKPDGTLGEEFDVAGGSVLEDKLNQVAMGSYVHMKYEGKKPSKTPGRNYNDWKVFVDENAVKFAELGGVAKVAVAKTAAPAQNTQQNNTQQNGNNVVGNNSNNPAFKEGDLPF